MLENKLLPPLYIESTYTFNDYSQMVGLNHRKYLHRMDAVIYHHTLQPEKVTVSLTRRDKAVQISL